MLQIDLIGMLMRWEARNEWWLLMAAIYFVLVVMGWQIIKGDRGARKGFLIFFAVLGLALAFITFNSFIFG